MTADLPRARPDERSGRLSPGAELRGTAPAARLGVALGGGGARGLAHIGVLQVLREANVAIGAIAGASMGAIVGGLYAAEPDILDRPTDLTNLLSDAPENPWRPGPFRQRAASLLKAAGYLEHDLFGLGRDTGAQLETHLDTLAAHRSIQDLATPFAATATDVLTGELVVLRRGNLARALHASAALPGVFTPVHWDSRWLIDGGVLSNLPVHVTRQLGAATVLAVSVTSPLEPSMPRTGLGLLLRASTLTANRLQTEELARAEVRLVVPIPHEIGIFDFDQLERLIAIGRSAALSILPRLEEVMERLEGHAARPA
ncbi:MAG TPA: patatin-like phospholipase family protein [Trueperaceae bacterium]|nr:patatin-like phospholipase family protein [Trueperaceae bacterium]